MTDDINEEIRLQGMAEWANREHLKAKAYSEEIKGLHTVVGSLAKLGDGSPAYPGLAVWRDYLGQRWEAVVVNVGESRIDLKYTNAANHAAKGCISRFADPAAWRPIGL